MKLDLHDFFSAVRESSVYKVFLGIGYPELVSFELARLTTRSARHATHIERAVYERRNVDRYSLEDYRTYHEGFLPQGAPTSGALSNLVMRDCDVQIQSAADSFGLVYTRYADDMAFSTRNDLGRERALALIDRVSSICATSGFVLHQKKTRIVPPGGRKVVLGLPIDGFEIRLSRRHRQQILTHVRGVELFGAVAHAHHRGFSSMTGMLNHVTGLLAFASDVDPRWTAPVEARWLRTTTAMGIHPNA